MEIMIGRGEQIVDGQGHGRGIASTPIIGYPPPVMAKIQLPEPGRLYVLIEAAGERSILDVDPSQVIALYKAHGALLLRGFGADVPQFRNFGRQFCSTSVVNESPGRQPIEPEYN